MLCVLPDSAVADRKLDWYDDQNQQLIVPDLPPLVDPQVPHRWVWKPSQAQPRKVPWRFPTLGDLASRILEVVIWIILALGCIWLLVYALQFLQNRNSQSADVVRGGHDDEAIQMQKLAELPFAADASRRGNLLDAARDMYQQGNFERAIVYLFGYQLLQLDRHQRIRLWKGKTNRQYLREVRQDAWISALLAETIDAFELVFFGHHTISREQFESCWKRMDKFHEQLGISA